MLSRLHRFLLFVFLLLVLQLAPVVGFFLAPAPRAESRGWEFTRYADASKETSAESPSPSTSEKEIDSLGAKEFFPEAQFEDVVLLPHRPLGMRVEESLADHNYVFVARVEEGGFASKAGIQVGDVLVGVTGLFGDMTSVIGLGVEKIQGMVTSRPVDEPLEIKVARGTHVLDEHEKAVIEICSNESSDKEVEQCVVDYLAMGVYDEPLGGDSEVSYIEDDDGADTDDSDPLDNIFDMWAQDLPPPPPSQSADKLPSEKAEEKIKPWSSRSSPSGTFVRDPVTGEMKNIDA